MRVFSCLLVLAVAMVTIAAPVDDPSSTPLLDKLVKHPEEYVVPGEYLVTVKPDTDLTTHVNNVIDLLGMDLNTTAIERSWDFVMFKGYLLLNHDHNSHDSRVLQSIAAMEEVERIEPNMIISGAMCKTHQTPNWGLIRVNFDRIPDYRTDQDYHYNRSATGDGVNIYVLDSGIRMDLGEFEDANIKFGWDFIEKPPSYTDENGHGTAVAGILVSKCCGIARGATLISVRILNEDLHGTTADAISGLKFVLTQQAQKGAKPAIINLSFYVGVPSVALDAALTEAHDAGISVVAASGNKKVDSCSVSPSRVSTVVSVAATNRTDAFWFPPSGDSGSNYGKCIDILAPGVDVLTTDKDGGYRNYTGTSIAAPFVAGAMATHISAHHSADPDKLKAWLHTSASISPSIVNLQPNTTNKLLHIDCI